MPLLGIMYTRTLSDKLLQQASKYPLLAILGPRQAGKTTLAKLTFPNYQYVNLENLDLRTYAQEDPRSFLEQYDKNTILDEIQHVPALFSYLQAKVDTSSAKAQYILTGSHNFLLMQQISQSLAGRVAISHLLPLSLMEQHQAKIGFDSIEETMLHGFYPRIFADNINPYDWYNNYILTYIERDVRQLKNILDLGQFQLFLKMCANRAGQLINLSQLANDCGITHNTAKSWLNVLETSFIIFQIRPHYQNYNKRLVKMPKLYFYDVGIACALLGITSAEQLLAHQYKGALFENLIITDLLKQQFNTGLASNIYFWRDQHGHEIDCILERASELIAIEIKAGKTINSDYFTELTYWQKLSSHNKTLVIYGGNQNQQRSTHSVLSWEQLKLMNINDIIK